MLKSIALLAVFVAMAYSDPIGNHATLQVDATLNLQWTIYKERHQKTYQRADEELSRRLIWEQNKKIVDKHNAEYALGKHSYKLGENKFADMTNDEFRSMYLGLRQDMSKRQQKDIDHSLGHMGENPTAVPSSIDWRTKGYVTAVKDQGQCGSCWSFSTTGSVEGQHFKATGKLVSLSEQNLMDCSNDEGNQGCNGGLMDQAFDYIIKNKGVDTETSYPYEAQDGNCRFNPRNVGATISSYKDIPSGDENALKSAVGSIGPVSVAIDASQSSFQLYDSGVYDEPECSSTQLDHGVLAVGYGTSSGQAYWIVKNSWSASWGMNGYIWMSRNKENQCGIATAASYPIV